MNDAEVQHSHKNPKFNKLIELYFYMIIAGLVMLPGFVTLITRPKLLYSFEEYFFGYYNQFLVAVFFLLGPIMFRLIFGELPIEYLRTRKQSSNTHSNIKDVTVSDSHVGTATDVTDQNLMLSNIEESKEIANTIFSRSGVYLLVGCLIAFAGIGIFYSPLFSTSTSTTIELRLLDYLPRFGSLFFIEFIAFFFLKQYRIMLEEYRYYERIKRTRQDHYWLSKLILDNKGEPDAVKMIVDLPQLNAGTRLSKGESTEILEAQKVISREHDLISKIREIVKVPNTGN